MTSNNNYDPSDYIDDDDDDDETSDEVLSRVLLVWSVTRRR
jgi:hypothetical protein